MARKVSRIALAAALALSGKAGAAWAEEVAVRSDGRPVEGAHVAVKGRGGSHVTDAAGIVRLPDLPPGTYMLEIATPDGRRHERPLVQQAQLQTAQARPADQPTQVELGNATPLAPVRVTANALATGGVDDLTTPAAILTGDELVRRRESSIGETLNGIPGISSTQFGAGASRPVIRGMDGPRIRVLSDGVDVLDASSISPDHAVTSEPVLAKQIEVLKGPATLLYGGGAIGGVVNVIDSKIPTYVPENGYEGEFEMRFNTGAKAMTGAVGATVGHGNFALRLEGLKRFSDDYRLADKEGDPPSRRLPGSYNDTGTASIGASIVGERGFIGLAFTRQRNNYGLPGHEHAHDDHDHDHDHDHGAHGVPYIKMRSNRVDVRGELLDPLPGFEKARLRLGHVDYKHDEIEDGEVATTFRNNATDGRFELVHEPILFGLRGVFGVQGLWRNFKAVGEEAYVPPTRTRNHGVFLLERYEWESLRFEAGLRHEWQHIDVRGEGKDTSHNGTSASFGVTWMFAPEYSIGASFSRSQRLPTAEELYANGPHAATRTFEVGDDGLKRETSHNIDITLRKHTGWLQFSVGVYRNMIDDFIYAADTGREVEGLREINYRQRNAVFQGVEGEVTVEATDFLNVSLFGDYVRAKLKGGGDLPRIPAGRLGTRLDAKWEGWSGMVELYHVFRQDKVAEFETETGGYNMLNAGIAYGGSFGPVTSYQFYVRANNLLNETARNNVSFIKDVAPLPGINFTVGARLTF